MKYRKKPLVIEAERWDPDDVVQTTRLLITHYWMPGGGIDASICTLEGVMHFAPGDWIITGVKGERYPIKDEIFRMTYEPVDG